MPDGQRTLSARSIELQRARPISELTDRSRRFVCGWQQHNCGGPFLHGIPWPVERPDRR